MDAETARGLTIVAKRIEASVDLLDRARRDAYGVEPRVWLPADSLGPAMRAILAMMDRVPALQLDVVASNSVAMAAMRAAEALMELVNVTAGSAPLTGSPGGAHPKFLETVKVGYDVLLARLKRHENWMLQQQRPSIDHAQTKIHQALRAAVEVYKFVLENVEGKTGDDLVTLIDKIAAANSDLMQVEFGIAPNRSSLRRKGQERSSNG